MALTLTDTDLAGFTGCDQWTRHWMSRNIIYSEGISYVAENAGAFWLLDAIASHEVADPELISARAADEDLDHMRFWTLTVDISAKTAVLECRKDSDQPAVVRQEIEHTDFPLPELTIYAGNDGPGTPTKLFLPSEY